MIFIIGNKIVTAVKGFFDTNQRKIFDDGLEGLRKYEDNKTYLYDPEVELAMMSLQGNH